jgi:hypothetical protein
VWSGRAVLDLTTQVRDGAPMTLTLATIHSPEKTDQAAFDDYEIVLKGVQPYPETPDNPIRREDYRAEFVVRRLTAMSTPNRNDRLYHPAPCLSMHTICSPNEC